MRCHSINSDPPKRLSLTVKRSLIHGVVDRNKTFNLDLILQIMVKNGITDLLFTSDGLKQMSNYELKGGKYSKQNFVIPQVKVAELKLLSPQAPPPWCLLVNYMIDCS